LVFLVALLVALFVGAIVVAGELGGEVVVITTSDERGVGFETSLWIVEDAGSQWLRAGSTSNTWYQRLRANPMIKMERGGRVEPYRAHPEPASTKRINMLMARDYGLADRLVGLVRDESKSMAIRLEPLHATPF
jgi:hypothetical protein